MNSTHNHETTFSSAHSIHKKIAMISKFQNDIFNVLKIQIRFFQIFFSIRVFSNLAAKGEIFFFQYIQNSKYLQFENSNATRNIKIIDFNANIVSSIEKKMGVQNTKK